MERVPSASLEGASDLLDWGVDLDLDDDDDDGDDGDDDDDDAAEGAGRALS